MDKVPAHIFYRWEFHIKNDSFNDLNIPIKDSIKGLLPEHKQNVEETVKMFIDKAMAASSIDGICAVEMAVNYELERQHKDFGAPIIRIELYTGDRYMAVIVNMKAPIINHNSNLTISETNG
jgi:hypothetical protein